MKRLWDKLKRSRKLANEQKANLSKRTESVLTSPISTQEIANSIPHVVVNSNDPLSTESMWFGPSHSSGSPATSTSDITYTEPENPLEAVDSPSAEPQSTTQQFTMDTRSSSQTHFQVPRQTYSFRNPAASKNLCKKQLQTKILMQIRQEALKEEARNAKEIALLRVEAETYTIRKNKAEAEAAELRKEIAAVELEHKKLELNLFKRANGLS